tara:strand:+ start:482 stop:715 length:234 start_codon:yes stop_codon:yes gene_type:complete
MPWKQIKAGTSASELLFGDSWNCDWQPRSTILLPVIQDALGLCGAGIFIKPKNVIRFFLIIIIFRYASVSEIIHSKE